MAARRIKAHLVIHFAATSAGTVGAGLAQIPASDNFVITPIQLAMIGAVAKIQGKTLDEAAAPTILASLSTSVIGRGASQLAVGWVPGYGNAVNATTAFALTEAVGWAAFKFFEGDSKAE